jgi:hypothetical protein
MGKTYCLWCFKEKKQGEPGWLEFPECSDLFFCSEKCLNNATVKRRGLKCVDFDKIKNTHAGLSANGTVMKNHGLWTLS